MITTIDTNNLSTDNNSKCKIMGYKGTLIEILEEDLFAGNSQEIALNNIYDNCYCEDNNNYDDDDDDDDDDNKINKTNNLDVPNPTTTTADTNNFCIKETTYEVTSDDDEKDERDEKYYATKQDSKYVFNYNIENNEATDITQTLGMNYKINIPRNDINEFQQLHNKTEAIQDCHCLGLFLNIECGGSKDIAFNNVNSEFYFLVKKYCSASSPYAQKNGYHYCHNQANRYPQSIEIRYADLLNNYFPTINMDHSISRVLANNNVLELMESRLDLSLMTKLWNVFETSCNVDELTVVMTYLLFIYRSHFSIDCYYFIKRKMLDEFSKIIIKLEKVSHYYVFQLEILLIRDCILYGLPAEYNIKDFIKILNGLLLDLLPKLNDVNKKNVVLKYSCHIIKYIRMQDFVKNFKSLLPILSFFKDCNTDANSINNKDELEETKLVKLIILISVFKYYVLFCRISITGDKNTQNSQVLLLNKLYEGFKDEVVKIPDLYKNNKDVLEAMNDLDGIFKRGLNIVV
ncbi:uncharacterized protein SCDLUD_000851 [Saccharomycodes ludwigii]|uniref:uncharacterized protein n=1 Tax=Saccharomycodes ludwigii TaxID=36035 RepID=UPI001E8916EA|nr:hypothetical protein SCDLUD_000851 [Saccharomycodes ludwigii]KAH3903230.1 hypothetical protein SCDLUD_000851 [Saccharomycodes ludwigii]